MPTIERSSHIRLSPDLLGVVKASFRLARKNGDSKVTYDHLGASLPPTHSLEGLGFGPDYFLEALDRSRRKVKKREEQDGSPKVQKSLRLDSDFTNLLIQAQRLAKLEKSDRVELNHIVGLLTDPNQQVSLPELVLFNSPFIKTETTVAA